MTDINSKRPTVAMALVVFWSMFGVAQAENACVSCDGPVAVYSCSAAPDENGRAPSRSKRALQFACIQDVARRYRHSSCSVKRNQVGSCTGQVHMLSGLPISSQLTPKATTQPHTASDNQQEPEKRLKRSADEPRTMIELAKRTAKSTQKELDRSARKVSKAARSTWRCVSTLFSDC